MALVTDRRGSAHKALAAPTACMSGRCVTPRPRGPSDAVVSSSRYPDRILRQLRGAARGQRQGSSAGQQRRPAALCFSSAGRASSAEQRPGPSGGLALAMITNRESQRWDGPRRARRPGWYAVVVTRGGPEGSARGEDTAPGTGAPAPPPLVGGYAYWHRKRSRRLDKQRGR